jgi:hypothetical protein
VRRLTILLAALAAGVGILVAVLLAFSTVPRQRVVDGYLLFVGGMLMFGLVRATRQAGESEPTSSVYDRALRRRERAPARPGELAKLEREVALAAGSSFDVHFRLRPVLREIAAHRLATRRGLALDGGSLEVAALLGDELWEVVRPDREPPDDRFGPGLPLARLRGALERLERI